MHTKCSRTNEELTAMLDEELSQPDYDQLPKYMLPAVYQYVVDGRPPGTFLEAVITNNLRHALTCADDRNLKVLPVWVRFFYNCVPAACVGDAHDMTNWMRERGNTDV